MNAAAAAADDAEATATAMAAAVVEARPLVADGDSARSTSEAVLGPGPLQRRK